MRSAGLPSKIPHHRDRIDDDDLAALLDLHAGVAQRGNRDGAPGASTAVVVGD
jgi:hypothetical protein